MYSSHAAKQIMLFRIVLKKKKVKKKSRKKERKKEEESNKHHFSPWPKSSHLLAAVTWLITSGVRTPGQTRSECQVQLSTHWAS